MSTFQGNYQNGWKRFHRVDFRLWLSCLLALVSEYNWSTSDNGICTFTQTQVLRVHKFCSTNYYILTNTFWDTFVAQTQIINYNCLNLLLGNVTNGRFMHFPFCTIYHNDLCICRARGRHCSEVWELETSPVAPRKIALPSWAGTWCLVV